VDIKPHNILVCRTDALGDTILTLPVCTALKQAFPQARVSMLVSPYTREAVVHQLDIDQVITYDVKHAHAQRAGFLRFLHMLKTERFDTALVVFPDPRISWGLFRAGVPRRVGTSRRLWSFLYTIKVKHSRLKAEKHEAEYNLDLVRALGVTAELKPPQLKVTSAARAWADDYYRNLGIKSDDKLIVIHPGGRGSAANWGPEQYGRLAQILRQAYQCKILLTGSESEQPLLGAVARCCSQQVYRLQQVITLQQLAALLSRANVVVVGNTGPLHMACALDVPVVTIFPPAGVTGPTRWGPLGRRAVVLTPPLDEKPVDLKRVSPEQAAEKAGTLLRSIQETGSYG